MLTICDFEESVPVASTLLRPVMEYLMANRILLESTFLLRLVAAISSTSSCFFVEVRWSTPGANTSFTNERLAWRKATVPLSSLLNRLGDAKLLNTPANWAAEITSVSFRNSSTRFLRSLELAFRYKSNASRGLLPKAVILPLVQ